MNNLLVTSQRPIGPHLMSMEWRDLLFAHWRVPASLLQPFVPANCELDLFNGEAWLGVVPFEMWNTRPRWLPGFPGATNFLELNVRTYVTDGEHPGVLFFSLDATSAFAVFGARTFFRLPYFNAEISLLRHGGIDNSEIEYNARRRDSRGPPASLRCRYYPTGKVRYAESGSLDAWLTERYFLYTTDRSGKAAMAQVFHPAWPLQPAQAQFELLDMTQLLGIDLPSLPDHLLFSKSLAVTATRLYPVTRK